MNNTRIARKIRASSFLLALMCLLPLAVQAQGLRPLSIEMEDDAALSYIFHRCGGLYLSTLEWVGEERMGPDQTQAYKNLGLLFVSSAVNATGDGTNGDTQQQVLESMREIADLYLYRYKTLFTASGLEITEDGLWNSDLETCAVVANGASDG